MRVITGSARGCKLSTLEGAAVARPTTDRVKEMIFSAIQFDIEGRKVLDLFAGSGQLGIECLSRGAVSAVFVDKNNACGKVIKENLEHAKLAEKAKVLVGDYKSFLETTVETFNIIFLDPPYKSGLQVSSINACEKVLEPGGIIICEHDKNLQLEENLENLKLKKNYKCGGTVVTIYRKEA